MTYARDMKNLSLKGNLEYNRQITSGATPGEALARAKAVDQWQREVAAAGSSPAERVRPEDAIPVPQATSEPSSNGLKLDVTSWANDLAKCRRGEVFDLNSNPAWIRSGNAKFDLSKVPPIQGSQRADIPDPLGGAIEAGGRLVDQMNQDIASFKQPVWDATAAVGYYFEEQADAGEVPQFLGKAGSTLAGLTSMAFDMAVPNSVAEGAVGLMGGYGFAKGAGLLLKYAPIVGPTIGLSRSNLGITLTTDSSAYLVRSPVTFRPVYAPQATTYIPSGLQLRSPVVSLNVSTATSASRTGQPWAGSGPVSGTFGIAPGTQSTKGAQNYFPRQGSVEFIFDPEQSIFVVGKPRTLTGSPHETLAASIGANPSTVVGGMFRRGPSGEMLTNEFSGHYWQNWSPSVRNNFTAFMESRGINITHTEGM